MGLSPNLLGPIFLCCLEQILSHGPLCPMLNHYMHESFVTRTKPTQTHFKTDYNTRKNEVNARYRSKSYAWKSTYEEMLCST